METVLLPFHYPPSHPPSQLKPYRKGKGYSTIAVVFELRRLGSPLSFWSFAALAQDQEPCGAYRLP